jgi:23S rRNA G2445 N2-methylase RlmL
MAQEVNVKELVGDGQGGLLTVSVKAIFHSPRLFPQGLSHPHFTALGIKNALCNIIRKLRDYCPDVNIDNPDLPLVAMLRGTNNVEGGGAMLSLYRSLHPPGSLLHKRGYQQGSVIHKASMKESLAAGLLQEAG